MKAAIIYPLPLDSEEVWERFKHYAKRFADTYRQFHPSYDSHEVFVVLNKGDKTEEISTMFNNMRVRFLRYDGDGFDLGSQQWLAKQLDPETFTVNLTTRCYFHCDSWLYMLLKARDTFGPQLYGCFASKESGKLHLCTRGHCMDAADWQEYPHEIKSRDQGVFVECGDGCLLDWFESRSKQGILVSRDGFTTKGAWFNVPNRFRNGTQSNCLIWDRHTDLYAEADTEEKERLERMCLGE